MMKLGLAAAALLASVAAQGQSSPKGGSRATGLKGDPGLFFGPDAYPPEAIRAGEQGRVTVRLSIGPDGRVHDCLLVESSGSAALDRTTCEISLARVTFTPATDEKGRAIAATYTLPVRWVLPTDDVLGGPIDVATAKSTDTSVVLDITLGGDGLVERCDTIEALPAPRTDPCRLYPVGRKMSGGAFRNGKPVRSHLTLRYSSQTRFDP